MNCCWNEPEHCWNRRNIHISLHRCILECRVEMPMRWLMTASTISTPHNQIYIAHSHYFYWTKSWKMFERNSSQIIIGVLHMCVCVCVVCLSQCICRWCMSSNHSFSCHRGKMDKCKRCSSLLAYLAGSRVMFNFCMAHSVPQTICYRSLSPIKSFARRSVLCVLRHTDFRPE